jgi:hypothetical protein
MVFGVSIGIGVTSIGEKKRQFGKNVAKFNAAFRVSLVTLGRRVPIRANYHFFTPVISPHGRDSSP